jgi:hypothetical protein
MISRPHDSEPEISTFFNFILLPLFSLPGFCIHHRPSLNILLRKTWINPGMVLKKSEKPDRLITSGLAGVI